jgi:hypothetical protein
MSSRGRGWSESLEKRDAIVLGRNALQTCWKLGYFFLRESREREVLIQVLKLSDFTLVCPNLAKSEKIKKIGGIQQGFTQIHSYLESLVHRHSFGRKLGTISEKGHVREF